MIHIIWEFQINPAHVAEFEQMYGLQDAWVKLFQQAPDYQGTLLLKDPIVAQRYITIDRWNHLKAYESFKVQHAAIYHDLDQQGETLTLTERKLGIFEEI